MSAAGWRNTSDSVLRMRRSASALLSLFLLVGATACGDSSSDDADGSSVDAGDCGAVVTFTGRDSFDGA